MEGNVRSGGVVKKKGSSGCLIIKKKDDRMGMGSGGGSGVRGSEKVKKRVRMVESDSESSEESLEPIRRKGGEKSHNGSGGSVKSGVESREFGRNGKMESERKRSKLDLFDFDEYDEFEEEMKWNAARTGSSSRKLMIEKRKHSNIDSSSSLSASRTKGDEYDVKKKHGLDDDDEAHMPISFLRLKSQESSQEPIRYQGKNGVLKVMVNKKKKIDLSLKDYDVESRKGSSSVDVVQKNLSGQSSLYSDSKSPEKRPSSIKTEQAELKSQKPFLGKGIKSIDAGTDTSLKLALPSMQPASSKARGIKEESRSVEAEDVTPAKRKEGKLKRRMEKQPLQPAKSKARVIKEDSRSIAAEKATPAKSKEGKLKRGGNTEKQQLRERIRGMLIEAGWTIDYRPRRNRDYLDAVYINPSGTAYWSIIKAYDALQKQSGEDPGKSKRDGGSTSFAPLADDLINKLTRQTRKKIENEMKKKRKEDAKNRDYMKPIEESSEDTDDDQHEERLSSYVKKKGKVLKCKSRATDQESDGDTSGDSSKGGRSRQDMSGKSPIRAASSAIQERKSRIIGRCTLLVRRSDKEQDSENDGYVPYTGKRTLLAWMIDSGTVNLSQKVQYMNRRRTRVKLEGWITRDGVHCGCCSKILPVSKFELHAGSTLRQPYQNIILESGISLLECLVDAWNRQEESDRQDFHTVNVDSDDPDDDTCGICGDGGDLICCDGCPSTFHQSCLGIQMLPPGDWHCPNCTCKFCKTASTVIEESEGVVDELLWCRFCEKKYHKSCSLDMNSLLASSNNPSVSFCGQKCQELYDHLQKLLGVKHEIEAGFSWSLIQRTDLDSDRSHHAFSQRVECNSKLAVALAVMDECFLPIVDRKSGINIIHNVLYNCGSNFTRLNFRGFYTAILERGDEIISAASIRIHGTQLAEMPYIGTRNIYRRQGMCRRLLSAIETVLSTLEVQKLIIPAISEHMHTWTVVFGFGPLEESQRLEMKSINMLVFPGTDMLQKRLLNGETLEAGINAGDSKHSVPRLPALVEKVDEDSPTKCDGNLHDQACVEKIDDDVGASDSPSTPIDLSDSAMVRTQVGASDFPSTPVDLNDSDMVRTQGADRGLDIQISSKEVTSVQSDVEKKLPEPTTKSIEPTKCDGNLHDQACVEKTDDGVGAFDSPSTPVDFSDSATVRTQGADCGLDIQISGKEATPVQSNVEKKLPESTKKSIEPTMCDGNLHDQACVEKTDDGVGASDSPSTPVDLSDSAMVRTQGADCGLDIQISGREATSVQSNVEKKLPESTTKSIPSSPSGASVGNADSRDALSSPSTEVDGQSSEPVHQKLCISLDEASARNIEVEKQNEEVSDNTSIVANGKSLSADIRDSCFLEPAVLSAVEENDKTEVSVCVSATCASTKPAINVLPDSTQPSTPDVQNGRNATLKQTSDIKCFGDGDVNLEEGNLDASPIGDGVSDNNGAEVSSSKPAIDSSVETSLDASPENNTDCQLSLSPGSQACGLNPSAGCSEAKVFLDEKIIYSEPSKAETQEVTVVSSCSGNVDSSANVSAELAAEEKI
ncbi:putative G-type lectin S-receptor-like serine/threonine-protein kinase RLK1-like [Capsicum annuum]|nr:putative G-type lectin S-receptor-like serine/threonine-protein kinase RLK1-like [Capsicum annuum]